MRRYRISVHAPGHGAPIVDVSHLRFDRARDADAVARLWREAYPRCAFFVVAA